MKERDIFVAALAITKVEERDAFLDEACSEPGQKEHLRALLEAEARLGTFLESPARATESTGVVKHAPARSSARTNSWSRSAKGDWAWSSWPSRPAGSPHGRAQGHQAGHGHPPGDRPL